MWYRLSRDHYHKCILWFLRKCYSHAHLNYVNLTTMFFSQMYFFSWGVRLFWQFAQFGGEPDRRILREFLVSWPVPASVWFSLLFHGESGENITYNHSIHSNCTWLSFPLSTVSRNVHIHKMLWANVLHGDNFGVTVLLMPLCSS